METKMTIDQAFECPKCKATKVNLDNICQLFEDARYEDVTCMECGTKWRVYYKMLDINKTDVVMSPDDVPTTDVPTMEEIPLVDSVEELETAEIPANGAEVEPIVEPEA